MSDDRNFDGAVATAERALVYLKQLRTPPVPQNFELLYTYAAGHNAELNEALRDAVFAHARLPEAEIQRLLAAHIPRHRLNAKVGEVGAQMSSELKQVIDTIHTASRSTEDFGQALEELVPQLDRAVSPEQLKTVAEALLLVTRRMAEHSRTLAERAVDSKRLIQDLHQVLEAIGIESLTDDLTGIANRRRFEQVLEIETVEADESADPLCLALVDVDHFKRFNDNFGHQTGDQMLRVVAQTLKHNVKAGDHAARYGGEEFALLFPRTALPEAVELADGLRNALKARELVKRSTQQTLGTLTLSIGIAVYRRGEPPSDFVQRADRCLYAAKHAGRDRVATDAMSVKNNVAGAA